MAGFTRESLQTFLLDELRERHATVELSCTAVTRPGEGTAEWVVEVSAPVKFIRIFRPALKGERAHAQVFAAELAHILDDYLKNLG